MKFLAIATLFVAGALAVPTDLYTPPGGNNGVDYGNGGYPGGNDGGNNGGNDGGNDGGNNGGNNGGNGGSNYEACPAGLYSQSQCCATDVLGVLALNCGAPNAVPSSATDFKSICASEGKAPKCCVVPVAGQDLLCQDPVGA